MSWLQQHAYLTPWIQLLSAATALLISTMAIVAPQLLLRRRERRDDLRGLEIARLLAFRASEAVDLARNILVEVPTALTVDITNENCRAEIVRSIDRCEGALKYCVIDDVAFSEASRFLEMLYWFLSAYDEVLAGVDEQSAIEAEILKLLDRRKGGVVSAHDRLKKVLARVMERPRSPFTGV